MTMAGTFCGTCGGVVAAGSLFCGKCGTAAERGIATAPSVPPLAMVGTVGAATGSAPNTGSAVGARSLAPTQVAPGVDQPAFASVGSRFGALVIDGICGVIVSGVGYAAVLTLTNSLGLAVFGVLSLGLFVLLVVMAADGSSPGKAILGIRVVRAANGRRPGYGLGLARLLLRGLLLGVTLFIAGFSPFWDSSRRRRAWWDAALDTVVLTLGSVNAATMVNSTSIGQGQAPEASASPERAPSRAPVSWADQPAPARPVHPAVAADPMPTPLAAEVPWDARPQSSAVITAIPGREPALPAEVERTRMAARARPAPASAESAQWVLILDNGEHLELDSPMLIGRDPGIGPDDTDAVLKKLGDETRSVSKTHLRVDPFSSGVRVTDRHSTNGVAVVIAGHATSCLPGQSLEAGDGATVRFGDREFRVQRK